MSRCCLRIDSCCAFNCCLGVPVWFCGVVIGDSIPGTVPGAGVVVVAGVVIAPAGAPGAAVSAGVAPAAGERTSGPASTAELAPPGWEMVTSLVPRVGWAEAGTLTGMVGRRPCMGGDPALAAWVISGLPPKTPKDLDTKRRLVSKSLGVFGGRPDMTQAAKAGSPPMQGLRPTIPVSVPASAQPTIGTNDVTISQPGGANSAVDAGPEVRSPAAGAAPADTAAPGAAGA